MLSKPAFSLLVPLFDQRTQLSMLGRFNTGSRACAPTLSSRRRPGAPPQRDSHDLAEPARTSPPQTQGATRLSASLECGLWGLSAAFAPCRSGARHPSHPNSRTSKPLKDWLGWHEQELTQAHNNISRAHKSTPANGLCCRCCPCVGHGAGALARLPLWGMLLSQRVNTPDIP